MNKIIRVSIPFILACLFTGMLLSWLCESNPVLAADETNQKWWSGDRLESKPAGIQSTLLVTTLDDELNTDGDCSLREAIAAANTNTPVDECSSGGVLTDTITFESGGVITVTSLLSVTAGGPLVIDGSDSITLSGDQSTRILEFGSGSQATLNNLVVADGYSNWDGGGVSNNGDLRLNFVTVRDCSADNSAGGIGNGGTLVMNHSLVSENSANGGGGILNAGMMTINDSWISGNSGGGIVNYVGSLTINNSTLSDNLKAGGSGAAIQNAGPLVVKNSTIRNNIANFFGGGLHNDWFTSMTIINSTISINTSGFDGGGGISNNGTLIIINSTIAENETSGNGGGVYNNYSATFYNTILADNSGDQCAGAITDGRYNISSDNSCSIDPANGSLPNTDPLLGPLQDNGGSSWTHELLEGSPAIDMVKYACNQVADQRGVPRPQDGDKDGWAYCDSGSYEVEGFTLPPELVTISGPLEASLGMVYFTATVEPYSSTLPLTYGWRASGHPPITETMGLTDTIGLGWEIPGTYAITVTASNLAGTVTDFHVFTVKKFPPAHQVYLPLIIKAIQTNLATSPLLRLERGGAMVVLASLIIGRRKKA